MAFDKYFTVKSVGDDYRLEFSPQAEWLPGPTAGDEEDAHLIAVLASSADGHASISFVVRAEDLRRVVDGAMALAGRLRSRPDPPRSTRVKRKRR